VDRNIEIITTLMGTATGMAVAGLQGGLAGGITSLRKQSKSPSIHLDAKARREIESSMHLAMAATWALRPMIEQEPFLQRQIVQRVFEAVVLSYTCEVTPYVQELQLHLQRIVQSGIKPEASLDHIRRTYAPRFMRKDDSVSFMIAKHVMMIQSTFGPITEARAWFVRWCEAIGLGKHSAAIWAEQFRDEPCRPMAEWKAARHKAAVDSYYADDEAA
jgi:hypothetical protein